MANSQCKKSFFEDFFLFFCLTELISHWAKYCARRLCVALWSLFIFIEHVLQDKIENLYMIWNPAFCKTHEKCPTTTITKKLLFFCYGKQKYPDVKFSVSWEILSDNLGIGLSLTLDCIHVEKKKLSILWNEQSAYSMINVFLGLVLYFPFRQSSPRQKLSLNRDVARNFSKKWTGEQFELALLRTAPLLLCVTVCVFFLSAFLPCLEMYSSHH